MSSSREGGSRMGPMNRGVRWGGSGWRGAGGWGYSTSRPDWRDVEGGRRLAVSSGSQAIGDGATQKASSARKRGKEI